MLEKNNDGEGAQEVAPNPNRIVKGHTIWVRNENGDRLGGNNLSKSEDGTIEVTKFDWALQDDEYWFTNEHLLDLDPDQLVAFLALHGLDENLNIVPPIEG